MNSYRVGNSISNKVGQAFNVCTNNNQLKEHLNIICDSVWDRIGLGKKLNITQGEETITDNILLYLASKNLSGISILKTPKNVEGVNGTDWEWWIGNEKYGYLRYAVQAKKINNRTNSYNSLRQKVGHGEKSPFQYDILGRYASAINAIPIYAFYNHLDSLNAPHAIWHCAKKFDIKKLGCTITPLKNVLTAARIYGGTSFYTIHGFRETIPLRCLAEKSISILSEMYENEKVDSFNKDFNVKITVYKDITSLISIMTNPNDAKQYLNDLNIYPKRILVMNTDGINLNL